MIVPRYHESASPFNNIAKICILLPSVKLPILVLNVCRSAYPLSTGPWNLSILKTIPESNTSDPGLSKLSSPALGSLLQSKERSSLKLVFPPGSGRRLVWPKLEFCLSGIDNRISNHFPHISRYWCNPRLPYSQSSCLFLLIPTWWLRSHTECFCICLYLVWFQTFYISRKIDRINKDGI